MHVTSRRDQAVRNIHELGDYPTMGINNLLLHTTAWMNLTQVLLKKEARHKNKSAI
jgi:hypothetical protein